MPERHTLVAVVMFMLEQDGKILLQLRKNTGFADDMWGLPGGHVEANEHVLQTVAREAKEELGIEVREEDMALIGLHHTRRDDGLDGLSLRFKITAWRGDPQNFEPSHSAGIQWFSPTDLPANTYPELHEVLSLNAAHLFLPGHTRPRLGTQQKAL